MLYPRHSLLGLLLFCRDAVGVFYSLSRLGQIIPGLKWYIKKSKEWRTAAAINSNVIIRLNNKTIKSINQKLDEKEKQYRYIKRKIEEIPYEMSWTWLKGEISGENSLRNCDIKTVIRNFDIESIIDNKFCNSLFRLWSDKAQTVIRNCDIKPVIRSKLP